MKRSLQIFLFACLYISAAAAQSLSQPPDTPKRPVTDEYQGVKVSDDYRWLENWDDPAVKQWSAAENARTRAYLDSLPFRPEIRDHLKRLIHAGSDAYYGLQLRAGMLFASRFQPQLQQPTLVVMRSADDPGSAKLIFDPNTVAKGSVSVDFFVPSFEGKYVAAALSENGSEDSSGHVFEVATGKELPDSVPRVNFATAGGSIAWKADSSGFYYTRYPQNNERPPDDANFYQQVYFHKLGTDSGQDTYVIGKDFPRIAEIQLHTSDDGRWLLAAVANGDGGQFAHYVMNPDGHWTQITHFEDGVVSVKFGSADRGSVDALYMLSRKGAPRGQILRLPLATLDLEKAKVIVPQTSGSDESARASIEDFVFAQDHLYVIDIMGGPSRIRVFDGKGQALPSPSLPPISAVDDSLAIAGGDLLLRISTYLEPPAWYRIDSKTGQATRTALAQTSPVHYDDAEVTRAFATSKDGTRVPLNIISSKGTKLDGSHPTLLIGYGGYGISSKPNFLGSDWRLWLDAGGVFVESNIRGGNEYGEQWHKAGNLTSRTSLTISWPAPSTWSTRNTHPPPISPSWAAATEAC